METTLKRVEVATTSKQLIPPSSTALNQLFPSKAVLSSRLTRFQDLCWYTRGAAWKTNHGPQQADQKHAHSAEGSRQEAWNKSAGNCSAIALPGCHLLSFRLILLRCFSFNMVIFKKDCPVHCEWRTCQFDRPNSLWNRKAHPVWWLNFLEKQILVWHEACW